MVPLVISLVAAVLFVLLGHLLGRRALEPSMVAAWNLFRTWWFGVAAVTAVGPLQALLWQLDALPMWLFLAMRQTEYIAVAVSLWALLCYLVFAYTGSRRMWAWLGVAYGGFAFLLLALLAHAGQPAALVLEGQRVQPIPGVQLSTGARAALFMLLLGPQVLAAIAYARLYFRVRHPTQRFRIALVSAAIVGWFGTRIVGGALEAAGSLWDTVASAAALAAAVLVLAAYFPPRWVQQRTGVETL